MVAMHSTLQNDLYVIYEGKNPDTDKPIIKVFLNPLMNWIWIGVVIVVMGTFVALVPNMTRTRGAGAGGSWKSPAGARGPSCLSGGCRRRRFACWRGDDGGERCDAVQQDRPRDDVRLRLRADSAGVQPCGVSGLGPDDRGVAGSRWRRVGRILRS